MLIGVGNIHQKKTSHLSWITAEKKNITPIALRTDVGTDTSFFVKNNCFLQNKGSMKKKVGRNIEHAPPPLLFNSFLNNLFNFYVVFKSEYSIQIVVCYQGGIGHWTVNYTFVQSFITTISYYHWEIISIRRPLAHPLRSLYIRTCNMIPYLLQFLILVAPIIH